MSPSVEYRYRQYMLRRGYARETVWARCAVARDWCTWCDDWRTATFADVETWVGDRNLQPGSTRNLVANVRAWYRWAIRQGMVGQDPTLMVDLPRLPRRLPRPAPDDQIALVLTGVQPDVAAMVILMACAGLRCVEVSRLDWHDVNLAAGTVVVMGKGLRERLVDLSPDVVRALARLDGIDGPMFRGARGGRLTPARVSQIVCTAFRHAGFPTVAHQLRHRCATKALQIPGADLMAVRDLLGHASVSTTEIYTAVIPGRTAATSRALGVPT